MISKRCREHCASVGETPVQHLISALKIAVYLQLLVAAVTIHAFIPRFFTHTASDKMKAILKGRQSIGR
jgi:hypothetical protein